MRLWEVATGESKATLTGHTAGVNSVAFSPDGTTLASGADDNTVWLWDAVTGQPKATFTGIPLGSGVLLLARMAPR